MNFDGINDYIRADGLSSVLTNQDFTLSLWFKGTGQTTTADSSNMLFSAHGSSTSNILRIGIAKSSGGIYFAATGSSGSVVGSADYDDSNWYHLVITKPYVSGGAAGTIYINGSSIGNTEVFNIDFSSAINYSIGQEYDPTLSPGDFFKGNIDEVAIWNKILNNDEIAALSTASAPANLMALSAKPIAYYPLGEFAGNSGELGGTPSGQTNSWKFPNQVLKNYVFTTTGSSSRRFFLRDVNISNSTPVTLSIWFKKSSSGSYSSIISRSPYGISINGTSQIVVYRSYPAALNAYNFGTLTDGNWHHLVYTGTELNNGIGKVYIDGIESTSGSQTDYLERNAIRTLGNASTSNGYKFNGDLSNYSIWTSVLTDAQVLDLYNNGSPKDLTSYSPTPERWLKLNSSSTYQNPKANYTSAIDFPANNVNGVGLPSTLTLSNSFTISFWAKIDSKPASASLIGTANSTYGIRYVGNSNAIGLVTYKSGIKYAYFTVDLPGISHQLVDSSTKTFHHFTIVSQGNSSSSTTKLYFNGQLSSSITQPQGDLSIDFIGGSSVSGTFDGQMSNIAIWDGTELNSSQVKTIYNEGTPELSISHSPTHWWKFNNTSNSSSSDGLYDNGSGSLNLTNQNGTATTIDVAVDNWEVDNVLDANSKGAVGVGLTRSDLIPSDLQFESPYSNFSLDFDGTNQVDAALSISGDWTISFWFNVPAYNATIQYALGFELGTGLDGGIFTDYNTYSNKWGFYRGNASYRADSALSVGNWHHCVITRTGNDLAFYADGVADGTGTNTDSMDIASFRIGERTDGNWGLTGKIDEVAIFSQALTATQVNQVYNNGRPGDLTSLSPTNWWRLGEDAFFVNNNITIPNQISGGPTGTGSGTQTAMLSADAPQSYGGGYGVGLAVTDKIGDAPESTANSISYNMIPDNRHAYTPGYAPAKVDNAFSMSFNGVDSFIDLNDSNIVNGLTSTSFSFWVNVTTPILYAGILTSRNGNDYILIYLDNISGSDFKIKIQQRSASGGTHTVTTSTTLTAGNWYNIVCTGTVGGKWDLYVNGDKTGQVQSSATITAITQSADFIAGDDPGAANRHLNGKLDEVAIFDYVLTPKQIKEDIYNASTTGKTADLSNNSNLTAPVAWYRMGD